MSDIMKSKAFDEFLQKRCEEITADDEECVEIRQAICKIEDELTAVLSTEDMDKFVCFESLTVKLASCVGPLLYSKGLTDFSHFITTPK